MKIQDIQVTQMPKESPTEAKIQGWLVSYLAELLEIDSDEIDVTIPFDRYGLDSSALVGLTGDLEDWLGRELDPTLLYDYPTIDALVQHLIEESKVKVYAPVVKEESAHK